MQVLLWCGVVDVQGQRGRVVTDAVQVERPQRRELQAAQLAARGRLRGVTEMC